jgi:hypothetical protein
LPAAASIPAAPADPEAQAPLSSTSAASPRGAEADATAIEQAPAVAQPGTAAGAAAEHLVLSGDARPMVTAGEAGSQAGAPATQAAATANRLPHVHIGKRRSFDSMNDIEGMSPPSSRQRSEAWQVQRPSINGSIFCKLLTLYAASLDKSICMLLCQLGRLARCHAHQSLQHCLSRVVSMPGCGRRFSDVDQRHVASAGRPAPTAYWLAGGGHQRVPGSRPYGHGEHMPLLCGLNTRCKKLQ